MPALPGSFQLFTNLYWRCGRPPGILSAWPIEGNTPVSAIIIKSILTIPPAKREIT
jgi:hypothetical protein